MALVRAIIGDVPTLHDDLVEWLVGLSANAVGQVHNAHRAVIAALSSIPGEIWTLLYKTYLTYSIFQNKSPKHCRKA